jgi:hypothetical protein
LLSHQVVSYSRKRNHMMHCLVNLTTTQFYRIKPSEMLHPVDWLHPCHWLHPVDWLHPGHWLHPVDWLHPGDW